MEGGPFLLEFYDSVSGNLVRASIPPRLRKQNTMPISGPMGLPPGLGVLPPWLDPSSPLYEGVPDTGEGELVEGLLDLLMEEDTFYDDQDPGPVEEGAGGFNDHGEIVGISRDRRAIYADGTIGDRELTPREVDNLQRTGTIDGRPLGSGGGGGSSGGGSGASGGSGSAGGGTGGGQQGGGSQSPQFPGGPGGGQNPNGLPPGTTLGPPFFPGGQGLPPSNIPPFITGGGGGSTGELGGPIQSPQESSDTFEGLLDSFDEANDSANEANEDRYNDILQGYLAQMIGANQTLDETSGGLANAEGVLSDRWNRVGSGQPLRV